MLSLVTLSPVITAFYSCCLSHHVFDQVNLWPAWLGIETAIFWQCSPGTVETECLYLLHHRPWRAIKVGFFRLINPIICSPYLVFHCRVSTKFVFVFIVNSFKMRLLNLRLRSLISKGLPIETIMSFSLFKNVTNCLQIIYSWYMYKWVLALNNL